MRIVITRPTDQSDKLSYRLRNLGAEPLIYPTIAFAPPTDSESLDAAIDRLAAGSYDWLMLTSSHAVRIVADRLPEHGRASPPCRVAAVGPVTAACCHDLLGLIPDVVPERFNAEGLADQLSDICNQRVLLVNADIAKPTLQERLTAMGAQVDRVVGYHTVIAQGGVDLANVLAHGEADIITFTSGSTIRYFRERLGNAFDLALNLPVAVIGNVTANAARDAGFREIVTATPSTEEGLIGALMNFARPIVS